MATISVRTNPKLKKEVQETLKKLNVDLSSAVNMYLQQIVEVGGIPFPILTKEGHTQRNAKTLKKNSK